MDSVKAVRVINALNRSIGFLNGVATKEGLEFLSLTSEWLEEQVLEPLLELHASNDNDKQ